MIKKYIESKIFETLDGMGLPAEGVITEYIAEESFGDITTNAAMVLAKNAKMPPNQLAENIVSNIGKLEGVEEIRIEGPGFINFTLEPGAFVEAIENALDSRESFGSNENQKGKRVMVEYTDPNPFKEFHIGHLMANAIGESIARIVEYSGATIRRANYQGDVGPHVARALWGRIKNPEMSWGEAYAYGAANYDENKEEIDLINKKVYDRSDEDINKLYDLGREESLTHFERLYKILGTKFDEYFFESQSAPIGLDIVNSNIEIFEESDGAIVYKGEQDGLHTRVFITSAGLPTYETKDLGLIKLKADTWDSDISITVTANEQSEYFKVMRVVAMKIMPDLAEGVMHITHGMMRLPSGKMSSRTGDVITGESLLLKLVEAAKERASKSKEEDTERLAQQIAVAAIKFQILKQGAGKDIVFDEEKALSLDGDSGPYIQYAIARANSVLEAAKEAGIKSSVSEPETQGERNISRLLMQFEDVVARAQAEYEPHHVASFAIDLASLYNSWYANERVLGTEAASRRVALTEAVAIALKNSLYLLGIQALKKM